MMNKQLLVLTLLFVGILKCLGQALPADSVFFNPTMGTALQTINPSAGTGDDTQTFINAINAVNAAGGGKVIVNSGTYRILEVLLKSNVHLEINSGATILPINPSTTSNNTLFELDSNSGITNCSISGVGGNFTVDMSSLATHIRIRVVDFGFCSNFKVSNFNITDNFTEFSALAFGGNFITTGSGDDRRITNVRGIPNGGIIDNISLTNGHYGYGLVQIQGGKNILFRGLSSIGGAALRLETGFNLLQFTDTYNFEEIKLDNIWARNIECANGQSALQISPHTLDQGYFNAENITATSCEFAVVWAAGFLGQLEQDNGLTEGSFDSTSKIRNVTAIFGQNAQMRSSRLRYIPCPLRVERSGGVGVSSTLNPDGESYAAPSPGSILREEDKLGHYALDFPDDEVTAIGYEIDAHFLPPRAIVSSSNNDFEVCNESVSGVSFFIPQGLRDTPNPRNPLENGSLSIDEQDLKAIKIYPNPTTGLLTFSMPGKISAETVQIKNMLGQQIVEYGIENKKIVDLSELSKGIYLLFINNQFRLKLILN